MKINRRSVLAGLLFSGGIMTLPAANALLNDVGKGEPITRSSLTELIHSVEDNLQSQKSLKGYKMVGTPAEYAAHAGLVSNAQCNAANARGYYQPKWMFDNKLGKNSDDFRTEGDPNRLDNNNRNKRHWVQFGFNEKHNDIVLKFNYCDGGSWPPRPTKIALVAPKAGENTGIHDNWTDTLAIEKSIATYRGQFSGKAIEDSITYIGHFKFNHDIQQLRMVVLEVNNDSSSSKMEWGPAWGLTELRIFDGVEWSQENPRFTAFDQQLKDQLLSSIEKAKTAVNGDPSGYTAAYQSLENAQNEFDKAFNAAYPDLELANLVKEVEKDLTYKTTVGHHAFEGTKDDYLHNAGLVNDAQGNADNANGYYKPQWMFDNDIASPDHNYSTEWKPSRLPANMRDKRHWVQFDVKQELTEMVMKFTNINNGKKNAGVTGILWIAPKNGESLGKYDAWTDTLYRGKIAAAYPTIYSGKQSVDSTTFVGKFKFAHPVRNIRLVVTETGNDPNTTKAVSGPCWNMAEMRLYAAKSWEESKAYRLTPDSIKQQLHAAIDSAKYEIKHTGTNIRTTLDLLKKSYKEFLKAYAFATANFVQMDTEKALGDSITFYVNHSRSGYSVDWGDGNIEKYTTDEKQLFNGIRGAVKGKKLSLLCDSAWYMLHAENCGITNIDLHHASELKSLYLANNALTKISLKEMVNLGDLDCSYNKIASIELTNPQEPNVDLPHIINLNFEGNQLTGNFDARTLSTLQYLNVGNNKISHLFLEKLNLNTLICSHNKLSGALPTNDLKGLANLAFNGNKITSFILPENGKMSKKLILDDNQIFLLNLGNANDLKYLSCTNNGLKILRLSEASHIASLNMANNKLNFSALPGADHKPQLLTFLPQDTLNINSSKGMLSKDNKHYAPVASTWEDREKTNIDLSRFCLLADKSDDFSISWYAMLEDGTSKAMTACTTTNDADFYFEAGKVSFFKPQQQVYAIIHSNVYDLDLPTNSIAIGDEITGIEEVDNGNGLIIGTDANGLVLHSDRAVSVSIFSLDGKIVWKDIVDGQSNVQVAKGIYIVNGKKIAF